MWRGLDPISAVILVSFAFCPLMKPREVAKTVMEPIRWFKTITVPSQAPIARGGALQSCCGLMAASPGDRRNPRQRGCGFLARSCACWAGRAASKASPSADETPDAHLFGSPIGPLTSGRQQAPASSR